MMEAGWTWGQLQRYTGQAVEFGGDGLLCIQHEEGYEQDFESRELIRSHHALNQDIQEPSGIWIKKFRDIQTLNCIDIKRFGDHQT